MDTTEKNKIIRTGKHYSSIVFTLWEELVKNDGHREADLTLKSLWVLFHNKAGRLTHKQVHFVSVGLYLESTLVFVSHQLNPLRWHEPRQLSRLSDWTQTKYGVRFPAEQRYFLCHRVKTGTDSRSATVLWIQDDLRTSIYMKFHIVIEGGLIELFCSYRTILIVPALN